MVRRAHIVAALALSALVRAGADDAATVAAIVARLDPPTWERYRRLNEAETRLEEYRDTDQTLALKLRQLSYINASRARYAAPAVELDILASRVANRQSMESAQNGFRGHWNLRGEKPYHRYAFAGGVDHVAENASATWTTGEFTRSFDQVVDFMTEAHDRFMAERAPNDGHKQTVIAKEHTHVGVGFYLTSARFAYYEEFVDRYLVFTEAPAAAEAGVQTVLSFRPLRTGHYPYAAITYYESLPRPMSVGQVNAQGSYPDYTGVQEHTIWPWELETDDAGITRVPFTFSRRGLYYVHIYLDTKPHTGGSADTRGKIQASGVVVRVD
jgi:uncharacterized protein YkwD